MVPVGLEKNLHAVVSRHPSGLEGAKFLQAFLAVHDRPLDYKRAGFGKLGELLEASTVLKFIKNTSSGMIYPVGEYEY